MAGRDGFKQRMTDLKRRYAASRITWEIAQFHYILLLLVRIRVTHVLFPHNLFLPVLCLEYQVFVMWQIVADGRLGNI